MLMISNLALAWVLRGIVNLNTLLIRGYEVSNGLLNICLGKELSIIWNNVSVIQVKLALFFKDSFCEFSSSNTVVKVERDNL